MALRGAALHRHIIDTAKTLFLESGYDRASMDAIAERAGTSKQSLYAHFPTKNALFMACIEHSHELFQERLESPEGYGPDPVQAITRYCARLSQLLTYAPIARACRMAVTEAGRLPDASARIHASFLGLAADQLAAYLQQRRPEEIDVHDLADRLLGAAVWPTLTAVLFGLTPLHDELPPPREPQKAVEGAVRALLIATTEQP